MRVLPGRMCQQVDHPGSQPNSFLSTQRTIGSSSSSTHVGGRRHIHAPDFHDDPSRPGHRVARCIGNTSYFKHVQIYRAGRNTPTPDTDTPWYAARSEVQVYTSTCMLEPKWRMYHDPFCTVSAVRSYFTIQHSAERSYHLWLIGRGRTGDSSVRSSSTFREKRVLVLSSPTWITALP